MLALTAAFFMTGCGGGKVQAYSDPSQTISVGTNQEFVVSLDSNPTTGYTWQDTHDEAMVKLVEKTYQQAEGAKGVGAGGTEFFRFKALMAGKTTITLSYKRPWEQEIGKQRVFTVEIK